MAYQRQKKIYQAGEPCPKCGEPMIKGKYESAYCWPCWSRDQEAKKSPQTQQTSQNTQSPAFPQIMQPASNSALTEALQKISSRLAGMEKTIEKNNWMFDQIMKKLDSQWNALSQDEIKPEDLPQ